MKKSVKSSVYSPFAVPAAEIVRTGTSTTPVMKVPDSSVLGQRSHNLVRAWTDASPNSLQLIQEYCRSFARAGTGGIEQLRHTRANFTFNLAGAHYVSHTAKNPDARRRFFP